MKTIRGAITAENTIDGIKEATVELLGTILRENRINQKGWLACSLDEEVSRRVFLHNVIFQLLFVTNLQFIIFSKNL